MPPVISVEQKKLETFHYDYLQSRGISAEVASNMGLFGANKFFAKLDKHSDAIGFPYYLDGNLVAVKYRSVPDKAFTQDAGGAQTFFGIDLVKKGKPIVIVEGEIDCLTLMQAGIENVVSVPSGAPMTVAAVGSEDKRFGYVRAAEAVLKAAPYVVIATDQDTAGQALAEELSRRIGKTKCRLATFPTKDLNEYFLTKSTDLQAVINTAKPYPVSGLNSASSYADRVNALHEMGNGRGQSTGYKSLDEIFTVAPSQLTVVTGYPSSGKSNFVDQLMCNIADHSNWKFAVCSFENQPEIHITRLMEIHTRKRFREGQNQMTDAERDEAFQWVDEHFVFIDHSGDEPSTLESILERTKAAIDQMQINGIVIDPYNYIDLTRDGLTETEAISAMLTKVQRFIKSTGVHVFFVAHPAKINRSGVDQPRPDGMSISGSMAWWAKTDNGLTVHRKEGYVEIAVWKCRYRWVGTQGEVALIYNKTAGNYTEAIDAF